MTLLLPYIVFCTLGIIINGLISQAGLYEFLFGYSYVGVKVAFRELFLHGNLYVQYFGAFWFLAVLYEVELLEILLLKINGKRLNISYFLLSIGLFLIGYLLSQAGMQVKVGIIDVNRVLIAQIYFVAGIMCRHLIDSKEVFNNKKLLGNSVLL